VNEIEHAKRIMERYFNAKKERLDIS